LEQGKQGGVGDIDQGCVMLRRSTDDPAGRRLDGRWYDTEDAYQEALRKRNLRRARIAARMWVADGYAAGAPIPISVPGPTEETVRYYCELLAPFWDAEHGWSDPWFFDEREWSDVDVPDGLGRR
jgi:hypothetical protein